MFPVRQDKDAKGLRLLARLEIRVFSSYPKLCTGKALKFQRSVFGS